MEAIVVIASVVYAVPIVKLISGSIILFRYNKEDRVANNAFKWTVATTITSLSPFLIAFLIVLYFENKEIASTYYFEITKSFTLLFGAISISSSAYLDYFYAEDSLKKGMTMRFKQNCNGVFTIIMALVLMFYAPAQLSILELSHSLNTDILTFLLLMGLIIYAYFVKRTIFETENLLLSESSP